MQTTSQSAPAQIQQPHSALIRRKDVEKRTALSRSRIYALMAANSFPKPIRLGSMTVAWLEVEINDWIAARIADSRKVAGV